MVVKLLDLPAATSLNLKVLLTANLIKIITVITAAADRINRLRHELDLA